MQTSLSRNLLIAVSIPLLIALVAVGWIAYRVTWTVIRTAYDQNLVNLANGVANRISSVDDRVVIDLPYEAEAVLLTDTTDHIFYLVRSSSGAVIAGDADLPDPWRGAPPLSTSEDDEYRAAYPYPLQLPAESGIRSQAFADTRHRENDIRLVLLRKNVGELSADVFVAETYGKRQQAIRELLFGFGIATLLILSGAGLAIRYGIPSGLSPLRRLERVLATRSGQDLQPIPMDDIPVEVKAVVTALNALFARLREANSGQREFLQNAAHQLRTPLASLQLQFELLTRDGPADPAALERLRQSVARTTHLANQLLALARAESGDRLLADAAPVALAGLIEDMLDEWIDRADRKHIDFGLSRERLRLRGDPTLLRELLANLVDNALKYTPEGGQITLDCRAENGWAVLCVTDSGPGIAPEERQHVFERFYRIAGTEATGSGLGLPIAREIARCHGGEITISTPESGCGTRICVRLPGVSDT